MNKTDWAKGIAIGVITATGLMWASAPIAQAGPSGVASVAVDRDGYIWHASGSAIRRCAYQEAGFRPLCSEWR